MEFYEKSDYDPPIENQWLNGNFNDLKFNKTIATLLKIIHEQIKAEEYDTTNAAYTDLSREEHFQGKNYKKAVVFLMSNGCEWALKDGHGCTMCGHLAKQTRKSIPISPQDYIVQFKKEFNKIEFRDYPLINVFNNGSFLNDNEVAPEARTAILNLVGKQPDIKMLVVESRPEYVTEENVKEIIKHSGNKYIEIAIGLELENDTYRRICFNKGFSLDQYNNAARIISKYAHLRTYVFLKPPFLTERESINQAIETVHHAFASGSSTVSLEAGTIQNYTLGKLLHERDMYKCPWLWSILEVLKQCSEYRRLIVGMFQFYPSPAIVPYNCDECSGRVIDAIRNYNRTLNKKLIKDLNCKCKIMWEKVMNENELPFERRFENIIEQLSKIL